MEPEPGFDPHRGGLHRGIDVAAGELALRKYICDGLRMKQLGIFGGRTFRVDQIGKRLVVDRNFVGGVLGEIPVFRDHRHHGLADIAHLGAYASGSKSVA